MCENLAPFNWNASDFSNVLFTDAKCEYPAGKNIECSIEILSSVPRSHEDFVGLYRVGYKYISDCIDLKKINDCDSLKQRIVLMTTGLQPSSSNFYQFLFVGDKNVIHGASTPFLLKENEDEDSDDSSSISDDFIIVDHPVAEEVHEDGSLPLSLQDQMDRRISDLEEESRRLTEELELKSRQLTKLSQELEGFRRCKDEELMKFSEEMEREAHEERRIHKEKLDACVLSKDKLMAELDAAYTEREVLQKDHDDLLTRFGKLHHDREKQIDKIVEDRLAAMAIEDPKEKQVPVHQNDALLNAQYLFEATEASRQLCLTELRNQKTELTKQVAELRENNLILHNQAVTCQMQLMQVAEKYKECEELRKKKEREVKRLSDDSYLCTRELEKERMQNFEWKGQYSSLNDHYVKAISKLDECERMKQELHQHADKISRENYELCLRNETDKTEIDDMKIRIAELEHELKLIMCGPDEKRYHEIIGASGKDCEKPESDEECLEADYCACRACKARERSEGYDPLRNIHKHISAMLLDSENEDNSHAGAGYIYMTKGILQACQSGIKVESCDESLEACAGESEKCDAEVEDCEEDLEAYEGEDEKCDAEVEDCEEDLEDAEKCDTKWENCEEDLKTCNGECEQMVEKLNNELAEAKNSLEEASELYKVQYLEILSLRKQLDDQDKKKQKINRTHAKVVNKQVETEQKRIAYDEARAIQEAELICEEKLLTIAKEAFRMWPETYADQVRKSAADEEPEPEAAAVEMTSQNEINEHIPVQEDTCVPQLLGEYPPGSSSYNMWSRREENKTAQDSWPDCSPNILSNSGSLKLPETESSKRLRHYDVQGTCENFGIVERSEFYLPVPQSPAAVANVGTEKRTHQVEYWDCPSCIEKFPIYDGDVSYLQDHLKKVHNQTTCPVCGLLFEAFINNSAIQHHVNGHFK